MQDKKNYSSEPPKSGAMLNWIDQRFPLTETWEKHISKYYAPKNFNVWYLMGVLSMIALAIQLISGVYLTMNYKPDASAAFHSVEYIMRDVDFGWLIRYFHSTGASFFFIVVYLHMFRGMLYGSYRKPRELVWLIGMVIFLLLMAEAFLGYLLPWGQMSFWGAQVIVNLFDTIPFIGPDIAQWIRGDYVISDITLNRFFSLHVIAIPLLFVIFVFLHIVALHKVGSNNPDGVDIKKYKDEHGIPVDGVAFHPYMTVKDFFGASVFLFFFVLVVFYAPEMGGYFLEPPNFEAANPLKTPEHIAPVWYFTPFYAMLRAVPSFNLPFIGPSQFPAVVVMFAAVLIWFALPWLDRSPVRSIRYKGIWSKMILFIFVVSFVVLGYIGTQPSSTLLTFVAQVCTVLYFCYFLLMPLYSRYEKTRPVPDRVTWKH